MTNDSSASPSPKQPAQDDLAGDPLKDEVFSIFILKSNPSSLVAAESYLRNRNWIVGSSSNLREALAFIIQKKPSFVMITCDHSNKKVKVLPKMLAQAFPVRVIGFAEKGGGASMQALNQMALEYNLYPPVSGPAIQRLVLKIRKDDVLKAQGLHTDESQSKEASGDNSQDRITFKGEARSNDQLQNSFEQARAALTQLVNSDGDDETGLGEGAVVQKGIGHTAGAAYNQGASTPNKDSGSMPQSSGLSAGPGYMPTPSETGSMGGLQPGESFDEWAERMRQEAKTNPEAALTEESPRPGESFEDWTKRQQEARKNSTKGSSGDTSPQGLDGGDDNGEGNFVQTENGKGYRFSSEARADKKNDSIIVRGAQQALDESVRISSPTEKIQTVERSTHVACITVEGPRFSGYLICALGKNKKVDKSLIDLIQKRLFSFLRANGEDVKDKDLLDLKIQEVDFQDWALEQAEFLKKSVHDGDEIAMAFFPNSEIEIKVEDSASEKMVKMQISELKDDVPLEFDLYIYMPENNKYLLYTPQGKPLYGAQKGRLQERGVTHMHLRKENTANVKKYRAQNFLNEKIASYKSKK